MGNKLIAGQNDFATAAPELLNEWDFEKNAPLKPTDISKGSKKEVWWLCPNSHSYQATPTQRTGRNQGCPICSGRRVVEGINDFATISPDLVKEWDFEKNAPLAPTQLTNGSSKKVWWKCSLGHSWQAVLANRTLLGSTCPFCAHKRFLAGFNDLATTNPDLAAEWDFEKNAPLKPNEVMAGNNSKVWWVCSERHSWLAQMNHRRKGVGCPFCKNKAVSAGFNDLSATHPELLNEWDFEKNAPLEPNQFVSGSAVKVWWLCPSGHSYKSGLDNRTKANQACPYCAGKAVLPGFNDLASTAPDLVKEWDFNKNETYSPEQLTKGSSKKVWWLCSEGHSWKTSPYARTIGQGCPNCSIAGGYDPTKTGLFYFIWNKDLQARKVGITNPDSKMKRLGTFGEGWTVITTFTEEDGLLIRDLETRLLRWLRKDLGLPSYLGKEDMGKGGGWSETFSTEGPTDIQVIEQAEKVLLELRLERMDSFAPVLGKVNNRGK